MWKWESQWETAAVVCSMHDGVSWMEDGGGGARSGSPLWAMGGGGGAICPIGKADRE